MAFSSGSDSEPNSGSGSMCRLFRSGEESGFQQRRPKPSNLRLRVLFSVPLPFSCLFQAIQPRERAALAALILFVGQKVGRNHPRADRFEFSTPKAVTASSVMPA